MDITGMIEELRVLKIENERLLTEVSSAWQDGYREGFQDWGTEIVSNVELKRKMDIAREFPYGPDR